MPDEKEQPGTDQGLMARAGAGDREAFDVIVSSHHGAIFALSRALTDSEAAAEDVLQETFLAAYRSASSFRSEGSVRGWLSTIARREASRQRRRRSTSLAAEEATLGELGSAAGWGQPEVDPETSLSDAQRRAQLWAALDKLRPLDREVIVLRDIEGLTGPGASEALGIPLAALKTRLHRARLKLMVELRKREVVDGPR